MDAAQLQQLMGAIRPSGRKLTIFSSADGVEWRTWRKNFLTTAAINGWDNQRQLNEISTSMEGAAAQAIDDIDHHAHGITPEALLNLFEARFLPAAAGQLCRAEFKNAKQTMGETALQWHSRLRNLFTRAFPDIALHNNPQLIDGYVMGLVDATVRRHVLDHAPATYGEALVLAQNKSAIESVLAGFSAAAPPLSAITAGNCWFCDRPGHQKKDCRTFARAQRDGTITGGTQSQSYPYNRTQYAGQRGTFNNRGYQRGRFTRSNRGGQFRGGARGRGYNRYSQGNNHVADPNQEDETEINQLALNFEDQEEPEN